MSHCLRASLALLVAGAIVVGCASDPVIAQTAAKTVAQSSMSASPRGRLLFLQCRACHSLNQDDGHLVGPNLAGMFGQVAGKRDGFVYSESAAETEVVWTEATLDEFLARPNDFFPGTKMAFAGIADAEDRKQLIEYLMIETSD